MYKKIDISQAPLYNIDEDTAEEFVDHRINIKKPLTQGAFNRALREAAKCEQWQISAQTAFEVTLDKGWQSVTCEYVVKEMLSRQAANQDALLLSMGGNDGQGRQFSTNFGRGCSKSDRSDAAAEAELERVRRDNGADVEDIGRLGDGPQSGWQH